MNKYALISVYNKKCISKLASFLIDNNYNILSSGGTYKHLVAELNNSSAIKQVSDITNFPEILQGRVKTLHPKIHGGILADRNNEHHLLDLDENNVPQIDFVIANLYPFHKVTEGTPIDDAIELIDIGGHTLIRAAAKNFKYVTVVTNPDDYDEVINNFDNTTINDRRRFASKAFRHILDYDQMINNYFNSDSHLTRTYYKKYDLKYGCNPYQGHAGIYSINNNNLPFKILNGIPGYINILDAIYGFSLVSELSKTLNLPAAASYKHNSPAGAAVYVPMDDITQKIYFADNLSYDLSSQAIAYLRARNSDPLSSFGDFIAVSHIVDISLAKLLKRYVSDGIIASGYTPEALKILKTKKGGKFIILLGDTFKNKCDVLEIREIGGLALTQERNNEIVTSFDDIVTKNKEITDENKRDIIVANIALKYTQSNSIAFAKDGQIIGIGAGQQNRVDCVKLAGAKARTWYVRKEPECVKLLNELVKQKTKLQDKVNEIISFAQEEYTENKYKLRDHLKNVSMASDAFFPFSDSINCAWEHGVTHILQPGGSISDESVIDVCNYYNMYMCMSHKRMFCH